MKVGENMSGKLTRQELDSGFDIELDNLARGINVLDHSLVGNGTINDATALNTLITSIGSTNTDIYFPRGTYKISTNVTFPSNINLVFDDHVIYF